MCSHRFPYGKSRKLVEPPFFKLPQSSKYKFLRNEISCLQATTPHGSYCMLESSTFAGLSRISSIFITICHPLSVVRLWQPCPPLPPTRSTVVLATWVEKPLGAEVGTVGQKDSLF